MNKQKLRKARSLAARHIILSIWLLICVIPLVTLVLASLRPAGLFMTIPEIFSFSGFSFENYVSAWNQGNFPFFLRNSLIIASASLAVVLVVCTPMAYGITRLSSAKMRNFLVFSILSTRFLPYVVLALPMYLIFRVVGLSGTLFGLVLAHLAMQLPFMVWLMLGFFSGVPIEVEESAIIDGCTPFQTFMLISLPMVLPGLNAAAILAFIISYNEFLFAFFLAGYDAQPLTVGIARFVGGGETAAQYGIIAAYGSMIIIPIVIFALVVNRYIVSGMTQGAVKG